MEPLVIAGAAAVVCSPIVLWWAVSGERSGRGAMQSSEGVLGGVPTPVDQRTLLLQMSATDRAVQPMLERLGARVRRSMPSGRIAALGRKLQRAGSPEGWTIERVLAAKALLAVILGVLLVLRFLGEPSVFNLVLAVIGTLFGYFLPDGLLDSKVNQRQAAIRVDVSDTIDQIGVMVRAGLGIDAAIARTARSGKGPFAQELGRVVQDMRVGVGRSVALTNMAERTDIPELRGFVAALAQAEKLGVPVSDTLRIQSGELRIKRRQQAEEQAMKLPVKILFPMVACILPVLFIVLLGPAAIRILDQFNG